MVPTPAQSWLTGSLGHQYGPLPDLRRNLLHLAGRRRDLLVPEPACVPEWPNSHSSLLAVSWPVCGADEIRHALLLE